MTFISGACYGIHVSEQSKHFGRRMASSGMLHHVAPVRTDVLEEFSASFIGVTRIDELGTTLAVISISSQRVSVASSS
jgi:hypothetical protein